MSKHQALFQQRNCRRISPVLLSLIFIFLPFGASAQLLYRISGKGLPADSYLFGTHHLAPVSITDSVAGFGDAFDDVTAVVGEIDMRNPAAIASCVSAEMIAPADSTLSRLLSPEEFAEAEAKAARLLPANYNLKMFDKMKPMCISSLITMIEISKMLDFNPEQQLDTYIQQVANDKGKEIIGLETPEFQAKILYSFVPIKDQLKTLLTLLDKGDKLVEYVKRLNNAYLSQDIDALFQLSLEEDDSPEFTAALLDKRNKDWMNKLPGIISRQPTMIVVGALHLPGEQGLIESLRKAGYKVTPVK